MADPFGNDALIQGLKAIARAISTKWTVGSFTNTGSAGGTGNYVDFGLFKIAWGRSAALTPGGAAGSSVVGTVVYPAALVFTSAPQALGLPGELTVQGDQQVYESATPTVTTSTFTLRQATAGVGATGKIIWFAIGT